MTADETKFKAAITYAKEKGFDSVRVDCADQDTTWFVYTKDDYETLRSYQSILGSFFEGDETYCALCGDVEMWNIAGSACKWGHAYG